VNDVSGFVALGNRLALMWESGADTVYSLDWINLAEFLHSPLHSKNCAGSENLEPQKPSDYNVLYPIYVVNSQLFEAAGCLHGNL
jgi:hypothetical protein